eukprot:jgi/Picsp_1/1798/NSC_05266-R1_atp-dependent rna helicase
MLCLVVKTLSGGSEVVVEVPESNTVSQLKIKLAEKDKRFKGCRLLLHGTLLQNGIMVKDLDLNGKQNYITACLRKNVSGMGRKDTRVKSATGSDGLLEQGSEFKLHAGTEEGFTRAGEHATETLLPGYSSRPNRSPIKYRKQMPGSGTEDIGKACVRSEHNYVDDNVSEGSISHFISNMDISGMPIPIFFQRLERTFDLLWSIDGFLSSLKAVRHSLKSVLACLPVSTESLDFEQKNLMILNKICPCIIHITQWGSCVNHRDHILDPGCEQCAEDATVRIHDPWKGRLEQIPECFKSKLNKRVKIHGADRSDNVVEPQLKFKRQAISCSQKRIRISWILRKSITTLLLSIVAKKNHCSIKYTSKGLFLDPEDCSSGQKTAHSLAEKASIWLEGSQYGDFSKEDHWCLDETELQKNSTVIAIGNASESMSGSKCSSLGNAPPMVLKKAPPCTFIGDLGPKELIAHLTGLETYRGQLVHTHEIPRQEASFVDLEDLHLSPKLVTVLKARGICSLYSHQATAVRSLGDGRNTVVCTSTASGKSLCYLIPILQSLVQNQRSSALLVFPTKALTQDQLRTIRSLASDLCGPEIAGRVYIYDGDTSMGERPSIRSNGQILLTNPDMLHCSILPVHSEFATFFSQLKFCVIDEAHMYKGVLGSHVAMVLRRLKRLCLNIYDSQLVFALTTATVANPLQHACALTGEHKIEVVRKDGSPHGSKSFVLWNPPLLQKNYLSKAQQQEHERSIIRMARQERHNPSLLGEADTKGEESWRKSVALGQADHKLKQKLVREALSAISSSISSSKSLHSSSNACNHQHKDKDIEERSSLDDRLPPRDAWIQKAEHLHTASSSSRSSPIVEISFLLSECVRHGLRTIAFCKTRKLSELVFTYTKEIIAAISPQRLDKISVYRAGYSPDERRAIESDIFNGKLLGVAATNALELGIDIGGLDCTLHLGFPGSVASLWQQAGRAGRRNQPSISFFVGWDGPLDQYFMSYPENLFSRPIEEAHIDVHNPKILEAHLRCAAHEAPLMAGADRPIFGRGLDKAVGTLLRTGQVAPNVKIRETLVYAGKDSIPARCFTLRDIDEEKFLILDESDDMRVVDNVESRKAFFVVYDGAILLKQGKTFICKSIDLEAKVAIVRPTDVKYYTTTIDYTDVHITGAHNAFLPHTTGMKGQSPHNSVASSAIVGDAVITTRWMGYVRIWRGTGQVFDKVDLFLPDQQYQTVAISLPLPPTVRKKIQEKQGSFRDGVHGAVHALMNVLPLMLLCNPEDVGTECDNQYDTRYKPERLLIFDRHPGGIGLCQAAQPIFTDLVQKSLELVRACPCSDDKGCPNCIQHVACTEYNAVISKSMAIIVLECALEHELKIHGPATSFQE